MHPGHTDIGLWSIIYRSRHFLVPQSSRPRVGYRRRSAGNIRRRGTRQSRNSGAEWLHVTEHAHSSLPTSLLARHELLQLDWQTHQSASTCSSPY